jgi:integrase
LGLLLGFAGAFRRSELVALDVADLQFCDSGLRVTIRKSKPDQEAMEAMIAIARGSIACPVESVRAWIKAAKITDGPVFRPATRTGKVSTLRLSARAVAELVKAYARRAGLKAADFSGHSLRSGFLTVNWHWSRTPMVNSGKALKMTEKIGSRWGPYRRRSGPP